MSEWLDYGAIGLLAVVLITLGLYFRERDRKSQDFLHELVLLLNEQQKEHTSAWHETLLMAVEAQKGTATALSEVKKSVDANERASIARYDNVVKLFHNHKGKRDNA